MGFLLDGPSELIKALPAKDAPPCETCGRTDFLPASATDEVMPFFELYPDLARRAHELVGHDYVGDRIEALEALLGTGLSDTRGVLEILAGLAYVYYALGARHALEEGAHLLGERPPGRG